MKKKILIIDDDQDLCEEISEILQDAGYETHLEFDGLEGQKKIEKMNYDVILLDYRMSGLDGIEILKYLKMKNIKTPVIISSGRPLIEKTLENEDLIDFVKGFFQKPFDINILLEKINSILA